MSPAQRRAAYLRIEGIARAKEPEEHPMAQPQPEPVNAIMAAVLAPVAEAMREQQRKPHAKHKAGTNLSTRYNAMRSARARLGDLKAQEGVHFRTFPEPGDTWGFEILTPEPKEPTVAEPLETAPLRPAPPRQPTRDDNRRIRDAMEQHYDEGAGYYRDSFTDEALAANLSLPRAWVTRIREDFYGAEVNEASLKRGAELDVAIALAERATERLLAMAQESEALGEEMKAARLKLGKGV